MGRSLCATLAVALTALSLRPVGAAGDDRDVAVLLQGEVRPHNNAEDDWAMDGGVLDFVSILGGMEITDAVLNSSKLFFANMADALEQDTQIIPDIAHRLSELTLKYMQRSTARVNYLDYETLPSKNLTYAGLRVALKEFLLDQCTLLTKLETDVVRDVRSFMQILNQSSPHLMAEVLPQVQVLMDGVYKQGTLGRSIKHLDNLDDGLFCNRVQAFVRGLNVTSQLVWSNRALGTNGTLAKIFRGVALSKKAYKALDEVNTASQEATGTAAQLRRTADRFTGAVERILHDQLNCERPTTEMVAGPPHADQGAERDAAPHRGAGSALLAASLAAFLAWGMNK